MLSIISSTVRAIDKYGFSLIGKQGFGRYDVIDLLTARTKNGQFAHSIELELMLAIISQYLKFYLSNRQVSA